MARALKEKKQLFFEKENSPVPVVLKAIALLVDTVTLIITSYLFYLLVGVTPITNNLKKYENQMVQISDSLKVSSGIADEVLLTEENKDEYQKYVVYLNSSNEEYVVVNKENVSEEVKEAYRSTLNANEEYKSASFNRDLINFLILCLVGGTSELVLILVIPLTNKRRATIGELATGILSFNERIQTRCNAYNIVGRFFFIFLVESVIPMILVGDLIMIFMPLTKLVVCIISKEHRYVSDYVCHITSIHKDNYHPIVETK